MQSAVDVQVSEFEQYVENNPIFVFRIRDNRNRTNGKQYVLNAAPYIE